VRTLRLAQAAAQAEALRLRRAARRMAVRAVLLAVAAGFAIAAVGFAHLFAWVMLEPVHGAGVAAAALTVADLLIAGVLVALAMREHPDPVDVEARLISRHAWQGVRQSLDWWGLVVPLLRAILLSRRRDRADQG